MTDYEKIAREHIEDFTSGRLPAEDVVSNIAEDLRRANLDRKPLAPRVFQNASLDDQKVGRAVRAIANELVGVAITPDVRGHAEERLCGRFVDLGYQQSDADRMAEKAIELILGP